MGYAKIQNLSKFQDVRLFKECYAMEKIHGTSAHITFSNDQLTFFSGGESHDRFVRLFNQDDLLAKFRELGQAEVTVFGEAYGGKQQGMSNTYGPTLKFVAFEVKMGDSFLDVPNAEQVAVRLGLEFVFWEKIGTDVESLEAARARPSEQAKRNGMGNTHKTEGVVLRPPIEVIKNNGERVMAKFKNEDFSERGSKKDTAPDATKAAILADAEAVANEWMVPHRMEHVVDKLKAQLQRELTIADTGAIIKAAVDDVLIEAKDEVEDNKDNRRAIGALAGKLFRQLINKLS